MNSSTTPRSVFLAVPAHHAVHPEAAAALCNAAYEAGRSGATLMLKIVSGMPTAYAFNQLWCTALNQRESLSLTHFVALHADVAPEPGWLSILLNTMADVDADVLSAAIPMKGDGGEFSTTVLRPGQTPYRLTIGDLARLPATFSAAALGPGCRLLTNSGCMVVNFARPWVERVVFRQHDEIRRGADGVFRAETVTEDFAFALQAAEFGARLFCTQRLTLGHFGTHGWAFAGRDGIPKEPGPHDQLNVRIINPSDVKRDGSSTPLPIGDKS